MKHTFLIFISMLLVGTAYAQEVCQEPLEIQAEEVTEQIIEQYIEAQGWCNQPKPKAKPGQIVIYYERDENGKCVAKAKVQ